MQVTKKTASLVLVSFGIFLAVSFTGISQKMTPVLEGNLKPNHPQAIENSVFSRVFTDYNYAVIGLECKTPMGSYSSRCIEKTMALHAEIEDSPILAPGAVVHSLTGYDYIENVGNGEVSVGDLIKQVPTSIEEERALRTKIENDSLLYGRIVSTDGYASLIVFRLDGSLGQNEVFLELERLADSFTEGKNFRAGPYASHYQNRWFEILAKREFTILGGGALLFLLVTMSVVLGWRASLFIVVVVIPISIIGSLGMVGHFGVLQNVLTSSLPVLLFAIVSSHAYHVFECMLQSYRTHKNLDRAIKSPFKKVSRPVLAAAITSTLGFFSLVVGVPVQANYDFGWFAIAGILIGVTASILVIPATARFIPSLITTPETTSSKRVRELVRRFLRHAHQLSYIRSTRQRILVGVVVTAVLAAPFIYKVNVSSNPPHFIPKGEKARDGFEILEKYFGGTMFVQILLRCETSTNDPKCLNMAKNVSEYASGLPDVVFSTGLHERVARMNRELLDGNLADEQIPEDGDAIAQFALIDNPDVLSELRDENEKYLVLNLFIYAFSSDRINTVRDALREYRNEHGLNGSMWITGEFLEWTAMIDVLGESWSRSNGLLTILLVLVCRFFLGSLRLAILALVPVMFANMLVYALMGAFGITIDIANFAITLVVGATAIDFYIHMMTRVSVLVRKGGDVDSSIRATIITVGIPIVFDCCSNLAFIALVGSSFVPIRVLGFFLSVAMVASLVATLVIVPSVVRVAPEKFFAQDIKHRAKERGRNIRPVPQEAV